MILSTPVNISPANFNINHNSKITSLGSCFADKIGRKLKSLKFDVINNPIGIYFNPLSLNQSFQSINNSTPFYAQHSSLYFHHDFHSQINGESQNELVNKINFLQKECIERLKSTDVLILTLGTAIVYELAENKKVIANCHKQNKSKFIKRFLSVNEIVESYKSILKLLPNNANIIITVSPIRHTKEGIQKNQLSKSILRVACNQMETLSPNTSYFPSYEIMVDELRDYRFYNQDLIHPSDQAVDYIFNKFSNCYFNNNTLKDIKEIENIQNQCNHKPMFPNTNAHQKSLKKLMQKMEASKFDFNEEIKQL